MVVVVGEMVGVENKAEEAAIGNLLLDDEGNCGDKSWCK